MGMMPFDFATAGRILFGSGKRKMLPELALSFGRSALVVHGGGGFDPSGIISGLSAAGMSVRSVAIHSEPDVDTLEDILNRVGNDPPDVVIGLGGGSVIDAAKTVSILIKNPGPLMDYLEVVGKGKAISKPGVPCIALPTTAGTGSEVTRNAVIAVPDQRVKVSLRSLWMLPEIALVDPELTLTVPPEITAATGMDVLTQLIEPYVSARANELADIFCLKGVELAGKAIRVACMDGRDLQSREAMSLASLYGGLALANSGLGVVHGLAGVIGGMYSAPHGAVCAALLPNGCEVNIQAMKLRHPEHPGLKRYQELAAILTGNREATAEDGVAWLRELLTDLPLKRLGELGVKGDELKQIALTSQTASSMKANPVLLSTDELVNVLKNAY